MPHFRTYKPRASHITNLRIQNGWSEAVLARKADCSEKTIKSLEAGKSAFRATLEKVASALKVSVNDLCDLGQPKQPQQVPEAPSVPEPDPSRVLRFVIDAPYDQHDESTELITLVIDVLNKARPQHPIVVKSITSGSVVVELWVHESDVISFAMCFLHGELSELRVASLVVILPQPMGVEDVMRQSLAITSPSKPGQKERQVNWQEILVCFAMTDSGQGDSREQPPLVSAVQFVSKLFPSEAERYTRTQTAAKWSEKVKEIKDKGGFVVGDLSSTPATSLDSSQAIPATSD